MEKCKEKRHMIHYFWNLNCSRIECSNSNILEKKAQDPKINGNECAKCCEVAANIAIDVLKMESEGIKAVKQGRGLMAKATTARSSLSAISDSNDMMYD